MYVCVYKFAKRTYNYYKSIKMQLSSSEQDASKLSGLLNEIENLRSAIEAKDEELEGWVARSN